MQQLLKVLQQSKYSYFSKLPLDMFQHYFQTGYLTDKLEYNRNRHTLTYNKPSLYNKYDAIACDCSHKWLAVLSKCDNILMVSVFNRKTTELLWSRDDRLEGYSRHDSGDYDKIAIVNDSYIVVDGYNRYRRTYTVEPPNHLVKTMKRSAETGQWEEQPPVTTINLQIASGISSNLMTNHHGTRLNHIMSCGMGYVNIYHKDATISTGINYSVSGSRKVAMNDHEDVVMEHFWCVSVSPRHNAEAPMEDRNWQVLNIKLEGTIKKILLDNDRNIIILMTDAVYIYSFGGRLLNTIIRSFTSLTTFGGIIYGCRDGEVQAIE